MDRENENFLEKCFIQDPSLVFRKIADECLLVPIRQNAEDLDSIFLLNEVGSRIWELLDGRTSLKEIQEAIVAEFEVSEPEAAADVVDFVQQLQEIGAVAAL